MFFAVTVGFKECDEEEIQQILADSEPANTRNPTKSAVNKYRTWSAWRIKKYPNITPPPGLDFEYVEQLSRAIAQFFCESRKRNNELFRVESVKTLFAALSRYLTSLSLTRSTTFRKALRLQHAEKW